MFDNIGRDLDEEARKRGATSLFLTTSSIVAAIGLVVGVGAYIVVDEIIEVQEPPRFVELFEPEEDPASLPPLPALPKGTSEPEAQTTPPAPDTMVDKIEELTKEVDDHIAEVNKPQGIADGDENGDPDGAKDGVPRGTGEKPGDGSGRCGTPGAAPCVRVFHHSELEARRKTNPEYPESARALNIGEQRCLVTVYIDEEGTPYDASVANCPSAFHEESKAAILQWRWYPPKDGKSRVKAQTTIAINYRLN